jgi:hypothetical protein
MVSNNDATLNPRDVPALDAFFASLTVMPNHDLEEWAQNWSESTDAERTKRKENIRWILKTMNHETREKFMAKLPEKQLMEIEEFTRDVCMH